MLSYIFIPTLLSDKKTEGWKMERDAGKKGSVEELRLEERREGGRQRWVEVRNEGTEEEKRDGRKEGQRKVLKRREKMRVGKEGNDKGRREG